MDRRLSDGARPFLGTAAVAIEGDEPWDSGRVVSVEGHRWSDEGQPTAYLASDPGVALAESGRHLMAGEPIRRSSLWRLRVELGNAVDLRDGSVAGRLGIADGRTWILDRERCRRVATATRRLGVG